MAMMIGKPEGASSNFMNFGTEKTTTQDRQNISAAVSKGKTIGIKTLEERKIAEAKKKEPDAQNSSAYRLAISDEGTEKYQATKAQANLMESAALPTTLEVATQKIDATDPNGDRELIQRTDIADISRGIGEILSSSYKNKDEAIFNLCEFGLDNNGLFGDLANTINNYFEYFGNKDGYFDDLSTRLEQLAPTGENQILDRIKSMVEEVRSGHKIDTQSDNFGRGNRRAVEGYYSVLATNPDAANTTKAFKPRVQKAFNDTTAYNDYLHVQAREKKDLLNKMLGTQEDKEDNDAETIGNIMGNEASVMTDTVFHTNLRHLDKTGAKNKMNVHKTDQGEATTEMRGDASKTTKAAENKKKDYALGYEWKQSEKNVDIEKYINHQTGV